MIILDYIRKEEKLQINNLSSHIKKLEKGKRNTKQAEGKYNIEQKSMKLKTEKQ